ncbi:sigma-70 family RNA polymerase sigma factor [Ancylobacter sp. SL191]|uniref:sigma-70 family RNA polymerase sigma factor n=1 Tax=Ancylobacter sp. SL191 TaxID=2995166 RepID=UPI0022715AB5|nr:sigma-70 family RNA polymerase sigma factor [Ancylobacter sp. SL191]WAC28332.1 sigma-70 family RNA polymerase sigma factor [Ancylobacter sp. SL191]
MPNREEFDRLIVLIASDRDKQAFALLYKHFAPRLKAFLLRSGLPNAVAEELAQEAMLSVWRKATYFDPQRAGAATWIFTIARNLRIDYLRRDRTTSAPDVEPEETVDDVQNGETFLIRAEREERLRIAMKSLSPEQATIVRLSFFNEKPHSEIASELGLPLGTVKSRVRLALGKLRAMLEGQL